MDEILLIESGFTTQLQKRTKDRVEGHPLWGSQCLFADPQAEIDTHRDFLRSGVNVMITNTYQASIEGFVKYLHITDEESYNLIRESPRLCRKAIELEKKMKTIDQDTEILIAGSVGSFGAFLADGSEYNGDYVEKYSIDYIRDWHRPRIQALVEGGVDFLAFETIPVQKEAEMLLELLKEFPSAKAWISFSGKDEQHIVHGEKFEDVAKKCWSLNSEQLVAVGINCTDAGVATALLSPLVGKGIPLIIYPNTGQNWDGVNKVWANADKSDSISTFVNKWCDMGVKYMGACCGASNDVRKQIRTLIDEYNFTKNKTLSKYA